MTAIKGSTALITGAASGIGLAMAQALAAAGAKVVLTDIDEVRAESAAAELRSKGAEAIALALDVRSPESWQLAADKAETKFGHIHILCSNAGVGSGRGAIEERSLEDLDWIWSVNARGMFIGVKTMLPRIRKHGEGGHIVITASVMGLFATPQAGLYVMSKYAAAGLAETLFLELKGTNIKVSALCPGIADTALAVNLQNMPSQRNNTENQALHAALASGMSPAAVGERVVKAIRNDDFYVFTHAEYRKLVGERFDLILNAFGESASPGHLDDLSYYKVTYTS